MIKNETRLIDLTVGDLQQLLGETIKSSSSTLQQSQPEQQDIIPIEEAMKVTNLARQTIYGLVYNRKIPFIKREGSRKLCFSRKALLVWLQNGTK
jgi:excisionase family DNA binding protein